MNSETTKLKVAIVGNHFFYSTAIETILSNSPRFELTNKFSNSIELITNLENKLPDIIFWNVSLLYPDSVNYIQQVKSQIPFIKIVCISTHDDGYYVKSFLEAGITGFITTTSSRECFDDLLNYISTGRKYISPSASMNYTLLMNEQKDEIVKEDLLKLLTNREKDVLRELVTGLTCKEIALRLSVSSKTVEVHVHNMTRKFNVRKSIELAAIAFKYKLV